MYDDTVFDRIVDLVILIAIIAVFILKLLNIIKISWFWLLCPLWLIFGLLVIFTLIATTMNIIERIKRRNENERY